MQRNFKCERAWSDFTGAGWNCRWAGSGIERSGLLRLWAVERGERTPTWAGKFSPLSSAHMLWCRHGVTHQSGRNKATSASDRRPSAPWVLSSAGKLIRYLHGSYFLPYRSADISSFVFYPPSLSFCRSARLFTERSLLHIMSRHAPYCWLATSLFWYSAPTQFSKTFLKNYIPCL